MSELNFSNIQSVGKIDILYKDDSLLAIDKPAGLPVLPDGYARNAPHIKSVLEPEFGRLWIVHRLDRETSGVLLLARTAEAHRNLNAQFAGRQVLKCYHAIVCGWPEWQEKTTHLPLRADGDRRHRTVVDPQYGKRAETEFHFLERLGEYSLVEAFPHTGRTHQIRAHLAALGFPLLGDDLYGGKAILSDVNIPDGSDVDVAPAPVVIQRTALHAHSLDFQHPVSGAKLHLEAAYPADFAAALRFLR